ncbi:MAG: hypothetical protein AB7P04_06250 [Bacteriovoracia bacterium]
MQRLLLVLLLAISPGIHRVLADENPSAEAASRAALFYDGRNDRYFTNRETRFSIRALESPKNVERIDVSINQDSFRPYEGKLQFDKEGIHHLRFRASDPVLNWSPVQHFRVYVDLTAPVTFPQWEGTTFRAGQDLFVSPQATLSLVAQDGHSGVAKTRLRQGETGMVTAPAKISADKAGPHAITFSSIDHVGNAEDWKTIQFTTDAAAPETQAEVRGYSYKTKSQIFVNSGGSIALAATDSGSGVAKTEYRIGDGPVSTYQEPITISMNKVELKFRSVDQVGNAEPWKTMTVYQDSLAPTVSVEKTGKHVLLGGKLYARPGFTVKASAQDQGSGIDQFLASTDGVNFKPVSEAATQFQNPGEYFLVFRAIDHVGNLDESNPIQIVIDATPPISRFKTTNALVERDGVLVSGIPNQLEIQADDDGVGIERIEVGTDGKSFSPFRGELDLAEWKDSSRTLYFRAIDRLGNVEAVQKSRIEVRAQGPRVDLFVESKDLPDVPLSTLKNKGASAVAHEAAETPAPEGAPAAAAVSRTNSATPQKKKANDTPRAPASGGKAKPGKAEKHKGKNKSGGKKK